MNSARLNWPPVIPRVLWTRQQCPLCSSFEFKQAEIGSGASKTTGPIALDLKGTYGQFAHIHLSHKGRMN